MRLPINSYKPLAANSEAYLRLIATMGVDQVYPFAEDMQTHGRTKPDASQCAVTGKRRRPDPVSEGGKHE